VDLFPIFARPRSFFFFYLLKSTCPCFFFFGMKNLIGSILVFRAFFTSFLALCTPFPNTPSVDLTMDSSQGPFFTLFFFTFSNVSPPRSPSHLGLGCFVWAPLGKSYPFEGSFLSPPTFNQLSPSFPPPHLVNLKSSFN